MATVMEDDEISRVAEWLEHIHLGVEEKQQTELRTPPSRRFETPLYEEVSPTNTTFSGASIFDKQYGQDQVFSTFKHYHDNISDASSVDEDDTGPNKQLVFEIETCTLFDYPNDSAIAHTHIVPPALGLNAPRPTTILSCLQCTLLDLPCSRSPPACTRCMRAKTAATCLLTRRLFLDEIAVQLAEPCISPVLLKLTGEDEGSWTKKMEVKEELMKSWRGTKDRENWVCPSVAESARGGWRKYGRLEPSGAGIGEGTGRVKFMELVVDAEVVRI